MGYICNRKNGFHNHEVKAVHDLLHMTSLRGEDSTGVFYITTGGDVQIHKDVGKSAKFLETDEWEATERELFSKGQIIVGHCRAKTKGDVKVENAHPFNVDNKIVLVHNGTMYGDHKSLKDVEVDSHAIAHVLAEEGDIATALKKINAAYALVWYNRETNKLHAIRNAQRPLFIAKMDDGSMLFSSEEGFLYATAWRNNLKIQKEYPMLLKENLLLTVDLDNIYKDYQYDDLDCKYEAPKKEEEKKETRLLPGPINQRSFHGNVNREPLPSIAEVASNYQIGQMKVEKWQDQQAWRNLIAHGTRVFVEAEDYKHVEGNTYYIYGNICSADERVNENTAGWKIEAPNEEEVVQYVTRGFYTGDVQFGATRGVHLRDGDKITAVWILENLKLVTGAEALQ